MPKNHGAPQIEPIESGWKFVKVPSDLPYIVIYPNREGGVTVSAPVGALIAIPIAYGLLEMARHYVDRKASEYMDVQGGRIVRPEGP